MARNRLDRKEMKEDHVQDTLFHLVDWAHRRRKMLIIVSSLLLVTGIVVGTGFYMQHQQQLGHAAAFFAAEKPLIDPDVPEAEREEKALGNLQGYLEQYPDSPQAPTAWMHLARLNWEQGNKEKTREAYNQVVTHPASSELVANLARFGLAKLAEEEGNLKEAETLFAALSDVYMGDAKAMALGRLALARNDNEAARKQFEMVLQNNTPSALTQWAQDNLNYYPSAQQADPKTQ